MYPVLVGVGSSPIASPWYICLLVGDTVPPFGLNVIVYLLFSHLAYNSMFSSGIYVDSTFTPSLISVYHPSNVYPLLEADGKVPISSPTYTFL